MGNADYLALITSQYRDKTNFIAWLTANLDIVDDISVTISDFDGNYDIDNAVGYQLDVIGMMVGVNRLLTIQPSDGSSPLVNDTTYRFLIRAKIAQNKWNGTIPELYNIWNASFPLNQIKIEDNQDMTFSILFVSQSYTALERQLIAAGYIMPKPEGVGVTYNFNGTFSFSTGSTSETDAAAGFSDTSQVTGGDFGAVS